MYQLSEGLNGFATGLTGANSNGLNKFGDENFAVSDLASACGIADGLDDLLGNIIGSTASSILAFGRKVDNVFRTTVKLGVAALAAKTFNLRYGNSLNADVRDCLAYVIELEWLDYCRDHFHPKSPYFKSNDLPMESTSDSSLRSNQVFVSENGSDADVDISRWLY